MWLLRMPPGFQDSSQFCFQGLNENSLGISSQVLEALTQHGIGGPERDASGGHCSKDGNLVEEEVHYLQPASGGLVQKFHHQVPVNLLSQWAVDL